VTGNARSIKRMGISNFMAIPDLRKNRCWNTDFFSGDRVDLMGSNCSIPLIFSNKGFFYWDEMQEKCFLGSEGERGQYQKVSVMFSVYDLFQSIIRKRAYRIFCIHENFHLFFSMTRWYSRCHNQSGKSFLSTGLPILVWTARSGSLNYKV